MNEVRRYRVLETLGKGGFGTVYRAELLGSGGFAKQVAIKILNDEGQREIAHRLRDEARILGLLHHRAVVGVDNLVRLEPGWAVVMEYVAGVDATSLIRYGPAPVRAILEIAEEVASALHAAYAQPSEMTGRPLYLIHRDIKPSNIRITPRGEVKILDFGVAQASFKTREARTRATLFGSFQYMAPERLDGIDGPKGDIYALGLVVARLLTGARFPEPPKHPRRHATFTEMIAVRVREALADASSQVNPEAQAAILGLVSSMISFEPAERPTARDVERFGREWRSPLSGPWLRDWAEHEIPRLVSRVAPPQVEESFTGSIFSELTGEDAMPPSLPHEDETSETMAVGPWEVAALEATLEDNRGPRLPSPQGLVESPRPTEPARQVEPPRPTEPARQVEPPRPTEPARATEPPTAVVASVSEPVPTPKMARDAVPVRIEQRRGGGVERHAELDAPSRPASPATRGMVLPEIDDDEAPTQFLQGARAPARPAEPATPPPASTPTSPSFAPAPSLIAPPPAEIPSPGLPPAALLGRAPAPDAPAEIPPPPDLLDAEDVPEAPALARREHPEPADVPTALFSPSEGMIQAALAQAGRSVGPLSTLPGTMEAPTAEVPTVAVSRSVAADEEQSTVKATIPEGAEIAPPPHRAPAATASRIPGGPTLDPEAESALPEVDLEPPPVKMTPTRPLAIDQPPSRTRVVEAPAPPVGTTRTVRPASPVTEEPPPAPPRRNSGLIAGVVAVVVVLIVALIIPHLGGDQKAVEPSSPTPPEQATTAAPPPASAASATPETASAPPAEAATSAPPETAAASATPSEAPSAAPASAASAPSEATPAPASAATATKPASTKPASTKPASTKPSTTSARATSSRPSEPAAVYPPPQTVVRSGSSDPPTSAATTRPVETTPTTPTPTPTPSSSGGLSASVRVTGDASTVWLVGSGGQRYSPGAVPPGSYNLKAVFPGGDEVSAGHVEIAPGEALTLKCIGAFKQCRKI